MKKNLKNILFFVKILTFVFFVFSYFFVLSYENAKASGASLSLSPIVGTFTQGSTFDASVFLNTGDDYINAVDLSLVFPADILQVVSPSAGHSFISIWIQQPQFSNSQGTLTFQGGVPSPGVKTTSGLITTITFRAVKSGRAQINFSSAKVLRNDGRGTDILTSKSGAIYDIVPPAPAGPIINSVTHPDQNAWYINNSPLFSWQSEEGVEGFSWSLDDNPRGVPDNVVKGAEPTTSYNNLTDGIWYFHVKAKRRNMWGGISTYSVKIDRQPPASFPLEFIPNKETDEANPLVKFSTTDAFSGIDHYELKLIDLALSKNGEALYVEAQSPYQFHDLKPGHYRIIVRAFDAAGNFSLSSDELLILKNKALFGLRTEGIILFGILVRWWILWLIITLLLTMLTVYLLWRFERRRHDMHQMRTHLEKDLAELSQHYKDLSGQTLEAKQALELFENNKNANNSENK